MKRRFTKFEFLDFCDILMPRDQGEQVMTIRGEP